MWLEITDGSYVNLDAATNLSAVVSSGKNCVEIKYNGITAHYGDYPTLDDAKTALSRALSRTGSLVVG